MANSVALTWLAPTTGTPPFQFVANYSTDQITWNSFGSSVSTTSIIITGLADATTYYFRVAATNAAGQGPWSNTAQATTGGGVTTNQLTDTAGNSLSDTAGNLLTS